jgi:hypothetical protein
MGMEVITFWPISGLGEKMVTRPVSPILMYPLMLNHSFGMAMVGSEAGVQLVIQLNPIIIPPPAAAETFKNERRLCCVFISVIDRVVMG